MASNGHPPEAAESSEEEDESSSSSSSTTSSTSGTIPSTQDMETVLASFRESWQRELKVEPPRKITPKVQKSVKLLKKDIPAVEKDVEDKEALAKNLFLKGVEMENAGKLYEAIHYYRRAVQLVPDIEFRLDDTKTKVHTNKDILETCENDNHINVASDNESKDSDDDDDEDLSKEGALLSRIQRKVNKYEFLLIPAHEQKSSLHIAALPTELLLYILKWVVSCDLDLRSLEMCAGSCRGLYLCARDYEIWRLACVRTWGINCGKSPSPYLSWREMYINRKRLYFNGCYISKTTYIRHGENSFQDASYRPWHLVAYYRYIRFFPEGLVLWLTTSEEPAQVVGQLKSRNTKIASVLTGHYRLKNDKVSVMVHRQAQPSKQFISSRQRGGGDDVHETERTFQLEFQIKDYRKRKHVQLIWSAYTIITKNSTGKESLSTFNFENKFPPLWFSRVKSYTAESTSPLI